MSIPQITGPVCRLVFKTDVSDPRAGAVNPTLDSAGTRSAQQRRTFKCRPFDLWQTMMCATVLPASEATTLDEYIVPERKSTCWTRGSPEANPSVHQVHRAGVPSVHSRCLRTVGTVHQARVQFGNFKVAPGPFSAGLGRRRSVAPHIIKECRHYRSNPGGRDTSPDVESRRWFPCLCPQVFQFYPDSPQQVEMVTAAALKSGFGGGVVVDYPNSTKAKKYDMWSSDRLLLYTEKSLFFDISLSEKEIMVLHSNFPGGANKSSSERICCALCECSRGSFGFLWEKAKGSSTVVPHRP